MAGTMQRSRSLPTGCATAHPIWSDVMEINYGNTIPISTIDWHGRVSIVFFLRGCPYRCPYCQNYELLKENNMVDVSELEKSIKKSKPFVSSMVLSGGEPLAQKAASMHLASFAKENGLLVGVHTNGFFPKVMGEMVKEKLVDKFFIDVKAPLDDTRLYAKAIGCHDFSLSLKPETVLENVRQSILLTLESVDIELRTTVFRDFIGSVDDVSGIARSLLQLTGNRDVPYVIQQGVPDNAMLESMRSMEPYNRDEMLELAMAAHEFLDNIYIRTREKGNEKVKFESI
ncbi:anaerobic ribonucleoside-triphosphate reductase activating protein [Methanolobus sp. ZRKC3]|uniref:anaerobic ribonucleoside-triphosphate reductase activating protein n=1 Tax=Methanolobus sp. ZRKC3 TaxID=3125786 RepID=UPI0032515DCD